jgi:hypothetical protein
LLSLKIFQKMLRSTQNRLDRFNCLLDRSAIAVFALMGTLQTVISIPYYFLTSRKAFEQNWLSILGFMAGSWLAIIAITWLLQKAWKCCS